MSSDILPLLSQGHLVGDTYQVGFLLDISRSTQSYRVTDKAGDSFVLRLFTSDEKGTEPGKTQSELMQVCEHAFAPVFISQGTHKIDDQQFYYLVQKYISGELLSDRLSRVNGISTVTAKHIALAILHGLDALQSSTKPVICNNLNCIIKRGINKSSQL